MDAATSAGPVESSGSLLTSDGVRLHTRVWSPRGAPVASVILVHGLGDHSGRYGHVAAALTEEGFSVHALDHRGHGRSGGRRVQVRRFRQFADDLDLLVQSATAGEAQRPLFMIGHSMGALVALTYVLEHPHVVDALVVSGIPGRPPDGISRMTVLAGRTLSRLAPNVGVASLQLDRVSSDPAVVRAYFEDPFVVARKVRARLGSELLDTMALIDSRAPEVTVPILILHGEEDALAHPSASRRLSERVGSADKTLILYPGLWHEIFNEPSRETVIGDVLKFLRRQQESAATP